MEIILLIILMEIYIYISGQLPIRDGKLVTTAGDNSFVEIAQLQMEIVTLNILSHVMSAVDGDKNRLSHVLN